MSDTLQYGMRPDGLGIIIIEFCFLLSTNKPIRAVVPTTNHILYALKRIFDIGDDRLTIVHDPNSVNHPASSDILKTFSPYYTPDAVNLFGRLLTTGRRNKPCIGLAMHHGGGLSGDNTDPLGENIAVKQFPLNKYATYDTYSKIIKLVTNAGYDVITFNSRDVDVEHKAFLLNELCECLIGYEGGTAHLAHMLRVPTIMLPWNYWYDGDDHWKDGTVWDPQRLQAHTYHQDHRTHFLQSQEEITSWNIDKLNSVIDDLYLNNGNNILYKETVTINPDNLIVDVGTHEHFLGHIPEVTVDFIKQHISEIKIH